MSDNNNLESLGYKQELKRSLSTKDLVVYGLLFMVPIAPFGIFGTVMSISKGMIVLAYLIGMVGMIFTAFSYWRMSEEFPISGSVYGYATHAVGKKLGFISGWAILLDYILIPPLLYVITAVALQTVLPGVPFWVWIVFFVLLNTIINILGIEVTAKFNWVMLIIEVAVCLIFCGAAVHYVSTTPGVDFTFAPIFDAGKFDMSFVLSAVSVCVLSFLGFDGISTLAEESKGGNSSVGRASIWALLLVGFLFIVQTYVAACVIPWDGPSTFTNIDSAFYEVAVMAGGKKLMLLCIMASVLACGISDCMAAQAAVSRILFAMSRDGLLPKALSKIHPKFKTPYIATLLIAAVSLIITLCFTQKVQDLAEMVNFGALSAFIILNFTVIYYFFLKKKSGKVFQHLILPLLGLIVVTVVWFSLSSTAIKMGVIWLLLGISLYFFITKVVKREVKLEV